MPTVWSDGDKGFISVSRALERIADRLSKFCLQGPDSRPRIIQGKKTGQESCVVPTDLAKLLSLVIVSVLVIGDLLMPGKLLLPGGGVSTFSSRHEMVVFPASWSWNMT